LTRSGCGYVGSVLRVIDWLADKVATCCTPQMQRRIGVIMCLLSLPLFVFGFFVDEPFVVYQMSAAALLFAGLSTVVAAVPSEEQPRQFKRRLGSRECPPGRTRQRSQLTPRARRNGRQRMA
jgi:hypothetical protein